MYFFERDYEKKVDFEKLENNCKIVIFRGKDPDYETSCQNCETFLDIISDIPYPTYAFLTDKTGGMQAYIRYDSEDEFDDIVSVLNEESPFEDTEIVTGVLDIKYVVRTAKSVEIAHGALQSSDNVNENLIFTKIEKDNEVFSSDNFLDAKAVYDDRVVTAIFKKPLSTYYLQKMVFACETSSTSSSPKLISETVLASYINFCA